MALPDAAGRVVWTGGDATPKRIGVVDWTEKCGAVVDVRPLDRRPRMANRMQKALRYIFNSEPYGMYFCQHNEMKLSVSSEVFVMPSRMGWASAG